MQEIIKNIEKLNKSNWKQLNFTWYLKKSTHDVIIKIIVKNLYKYDFHLTNDKQYFIININFIQNNILNNELNTTNFEKMYINLFSHFFKNTKDLWYRTRIKKDMFAKNQYNKKWQEYSKYTDINKDLNIAFNKFNKDNEHILIRLYDLTFTLLSKIHPFSDNNFWTISLLLDLLLLKNNYLPIWLKQIFKANNIFLPTKEDFLKIIEAKQKKYSY
jgi:hypothetical protein